MQGVCIKKRCFSFFFTVPFLTPFDRVKHSLEKQSHFRAPLCKGMLSNVASDKGLRDCFDARLIFTIPPSRFARHLPLHKGGSLPPDSAPTKV